MEVTRYFTKGAECVSLKYSQLMSYNILTPYNKHKQQIVLSYMIRRVLILLILEPTIYIQEYDMIWM